jgi:hypothetical protein
MVLATIWQECWTSEKIIWASWYILIHSSCITKFDSFFICVQTLKTILTRVGRVGRWFSIIHRSLFWLLYIVLMNVVFESWWEQKRCTMIKFCWPNLSLGFYLRRVWWKSLCTCFSLNFLWFERVFVIKGFETQVTWLLLLFVWMRISNKMRLCKILFSHTFASPQLKAAHAFVTKRNCITLQAYPGPIILCMRLPTQMNN